MSDDVSKPFAFLLPNHKEATEYQAYLALLYIIPSPMITNKFYKPAKLSRHLVLNNTPIVGWLFLVCHVSFELA